MECVYNMSLFGDKRIACFNCLGCMNQGSLGDAECQRAVLRLLREKLRVDELHFRKRDYTEFYDDVDVRKFSEVVSLGKDLSSERLWEKVEDSSRRRFLKNVVSQDILQDPIKAYEMVSAVLKQYERMGSKHGAYLKTLAYVKNRLERTQLIMGYRNGLDVVDMFKPLKQPSFMTSHLRLAVPDNSRLLDIYGVLDSEVRVYDVDGVERLYFLNPPELFLSPEEVEAVIRLKESMVRDKVIEVIQPMEAREYFKGIALELLKNSEGLGLDSAGMERLAEIFTRYTAGYGMLELLFNDEHIYDVFIDSPAGTTPVYVDHNIFGICDTNLFLGEDDLERISSKFRSIGGRPFDEANPVMDMELKDMGIRVAGIREPATFDGIAYSFRKRREKPWTLPKFVDEGMMSPRAAAILSMLVGGQRSILITGARGSGKTSLLSALIAEIRQNDRILLLEDTPEIPSRHLRDLGWRIEHLRNQPVISRHSKDSFELSPEKNLRAALRLGESVLVLGEVRGPEARALFEAMRVGAAGNAVLGTIHGSSPYDTWDRITNDLNVPATSFKAVDVVVSLGYRENRELSRRDRYLRSITEVRRGWECNPRTEGGFFDVMCFDDVSGDEVFNLEDSEVLLDIAVRKRMPRGECVENLCLHEMMVRKLVEASRNQDIAELLEVQHVLNSRKEYIRLMNEQSSSRSDIDYKRICREWRMWLIQYIDELKNQTHNIKPKIQ
ncbi:MAG: type II/IV secretion system ATPase subunit [Candidatus Altiarchaeota archaeon]|nr:type II/IV secretion system ATPase subunit [Candidatus Altiarchaeota archaeon]